MYSADLLFIISSLITIKPILAHIIWKNHISLSSDSLSSDLERIPPNLLASLNLMVDDRKLERLHNFAKNLPKAGPEYREVKFQDYDYPIDYDYFEMIRNESRKREAEGIPEYETSTDGFVNGTVKEMEYDLKEFKKEYDSITLPELDIQTPEAIGGVSLLQNDDRPFDASDNKEKTDRCAKMAMWKFIFFGFSCFWHQVNNASEKGNARSAVVFIFKIFLSWSVLVIAIASLMWCYNGSCCCCLPFEIMHPDKAMRRIKREALSNPPGVEKLADGLINTYQPSGRESKIYKKLMDQLYS